MDNKRLNDIQHFYQILDKLESKVGGKRYLKKCNGRMDWPKRGVYFFFEEGELRTTSGEGSRVVRVGTHALKTGSKTTLWKRLSQHQGVQSSGAGNHRGSIFRLHVGTALIKRDKLDGSHVSTWGTGSSASHDIRQNEKELEILVSDYIRKMPFLWLQIGDASGPGSNRGVIERNSIALLSNFCHQSETIDPASDSWLGKYAKSDDIKQSGLWNVNHVRESFAPEFLNLLEHAVNHISNPYK
jgi:hypothetical protein